MPNVVAERSVAEPSLASVTTVSRPLGDQLRAIQLLCADLSAQHRLALPADLVRSRLHDLTKQAGDMFSDRILEICFLLDQYGTLRYNELRRMLGVISTRTLATKLAVLHREGFVIRTLFTENPPRVEYRLSARGKAFTDLLFPAVLHVGRPGGRA